MQESTRKSLGIGEAEWVRIDHHDTIIAEVYRVTPRVGPPLILKISPEVHHFWREVYFLRRLAGVLPVPRIVQLVEADGAILMECLPGDLIREGDWSEGLASEVGVALARLHTHRTAGFGDLTKPEQLTSDAKSYFGEKFQEELEECEDHLPSALIEKCQQLYESDVHLLESVDGPCIIHRDFRPGNILAHERKLTGIIDWAGSRSGFAEQDFCLMVHRNWPPQEAHRQALVSGYASVRPVPDYEPIMPLLRVGRALAVIGYTVKQGRWENDLSHMYEFNRNFLTHLL